MFDARHVRLAFAVLAAVSGGLAQERGGAPKAEERRPPPPAKKDLGHPEEKWFSNVRQVTYHGQKSGEAYFSPDMTAVSHQSVRGDCPHYQIFVERLDGTAMWRVSPGMGLTTCSYWSPDGKKLIWASTHLDPDTYGPPPPEGGAYAWNKHASFDIFESNPDGSDRRRLTDSPGYDAEGSYSNDGERIVFTSERDGDLEIYTMNKDGGDVRRVTNAKGYDGGPFFSPDGKRICFRGFRDEKNPRYAQIFVIDADGKNEKQLTFDIAVNWAPYWHPDGETLVYSKNVSGHSNYDLFMVKASGGPSVRLSRHPAADVLPVFSPDGKKILWTSTRVDGRSQVFVADFRMPTAEEWAALAAEEEARLASLKDGADAGHGAATGSVGGTTATSGDRIALKAAEVFETARFLSDDAFEGRRAGTAKALEAGAWIAERFKKLGLKPAGDKNGYEQTFSMLVGVEASDESVAAFSVRTPDGAAAEFPFRCMPTGFSGVKGETITTAEGALAFRGYGLAVPGVSDDYAGLPDVKDKIVVLFLKGLPDSVAHQTSNPHADPQAWFGSYAKALGAKSRGAKGVVFVADSRQRNAEGLESPAFDGSGARIGIPCAQITRADFKKLVEATGRGLEDLEVASAADKGAGFDFERGLARLSAGLSEMRGDAANILGMIPGTEKADEYVFVTAHYDHLGFGGQGSLAEGGKVEIHNGADDNASGTAGLIALADWFAKRPTKRSIVFVAWSGEEEGLLGSAHFADHPTIPLSKIAAVVNLDMIGRYRADEGVAVDGVATAAELEAIVREANLDGLKISTTGGAMSGRSDHATFIAHGVPAIHLFTGAHVDYHKPSDDADKLDAEGMAKVAAYAGEIARRLANADARLAFVKPKPKESQTPTGSGFGAWFGSIPSYAQDEGGVKLSGVSAGSPAEKAGIKGGDVLIGLGDVEIDNIQDFTNALRMKRPGDEVEAVVLRGDEKLTFKVVLGRR